MSRILIPVSESRAGLDSASRDAECAQNPYRVLLRVIGELVRGALIMSLCLVLSGDIGYAAVLTRHELPMRVTNAAHCERSRCSAPCRSSASSRLLRPYATADR
jgi:hypothetical protein